MGRRRFSRVDASAKPGPIPHLHHGAGTQVVASLTVTVQTPRDDVPQKASRGKYITLAVLLLWVAAVFVFTLFKYAGRVA